MLDGAGSLLGVTVTRMNDVAALVATASVPQSVNFGIHGARDWPDESWPA